MSNITYIGGNAVDWNGGIDKTELDGLAAMVRTAKGKDAFELKDNQIFEVKSGASSIYLYLYANNAAGVKSQHLFDKNSEDSNKIWEVKTALGHGDKVTSKIDSLRRPGGGPTNDVHAAGTLARSTHSAQSLELLVIDESRFVESILRSELTGATFSYSYLRPSRNEMNNINLRCDGTKITYTSIEDEFAGKERTVLNRRLGERCSSASDLIVVSSVKDKKYLDAILQWYDSAKSKPVLVAAVTNSMLSRRREGLDVGGLVARSDIYASNIEELYDLLKETRFNHRGNWQELTNEDLYVGMKHILDTQKEAGKKGRVYVTCGPNGSLAMDSDGSLYWQRVSSMVDSPTMRTPIVDLNGAGDTFTGVMTLLESEKRYNIMEILDYSSAASQISIRYPGANGPDRITAHSIANFRKYHTQDIWKYNSQSKNFERFASMKCNLVS